MRTVVLHGALAAQFGSTFDLDIKSPAEAIRALIVQLRGFRQAIREGHYRVLKARPDVAQSLDLEELKFRLGRANEIHIVPVIAGAASAWGKILAGVAIVGLAIAAPYALGLAGGLAGGLTVGGTTLLSFGQIAGVGALVALGGIAQMLSPAPTLSGGSAAADRKDSFLFGSADNVTTQGGPVPVVFGEFVTGSTVISVGLTTEDTGSGAAAPNFGQAIVDNILKDGGLFSGGG
jgi:predicted phage tail protein